MGGFFGAIRGLRHEFLGIWEVGDATILETTVSYARKDGTQVVIPAVTIYRRRGDLATKGHVYIDLAPLFA